MVRPSSQNGDTAHSSWSTPRKVLMLQKHLINVVCSMKAGWKNLQPTSGHAEGTGSGFSV